MNQFSLSTKFCKASSVAAVCSVFCNLVVTMLSALMRSRARPVSLLLRCLNLEALRVRSYVGTDQEVLEYFEVGSTRYFVRK